MAGERMFFLATVENVRDLMLRNFKLGSSLLPTCRDLGEKVRRVCVMRQHRIQGLLQF